MEDEKEKEFPQDEVRQAYNKVVEAVDNWKEINRKLGNTPTLVARFETLNKEDEFNLEMVAYGHKDACVLLADMLRQNLKDSEKDFLENIKDWGP